MELLFPVLSPCVFLDKPLWVRKARQDIKEVDATPSHIALPLGFIPCILHILLTVIVKPLSTCDWNGRLLNRCNRDHFGH